MFFVYLLKSQKTGRYYIGSTKDLAHRLAQHNVGMTKATKHLRPWQLVYSEEYPTLSQARKREAQMKSWKSPQFLERMLGLGE